VGLTTGLDAVRNRKISYGLLESNRNSLVVESSAQLLCQMKARGKAHVSPALVFRNSVHCP
jgi:hypothetical protein